MGKYKVKLSLDSKFKMFTFNASSFALDPSVESFLKEKGAITIDFGATAYVDSEAMPAILSELVGRPSKADMHSNADLVAQLKAELSRSGSERQKIMEDNLLLASQIQSSSTEIKTLSEKAAGAARVVDALKAENLRLQAALKNMQNVPTATNTGQGDEKLRQSYEKLQKEFQQLVSQSAEAITSLKVFEDENGELREEIEQLRNQLKNVTAPKAA